MPSLTEIANLALSLVGDERIVSLDTDTSKEARLCAEFLPQVRDEALALHPWNFAKRRASLPASPTAPAFEWTGQFQVPADCLRILAVASADPHEPWEREGNLILCNMAAPLQVQYIQRHTDTGHWAPLFARLVAAMLAERLCIPLSASAQQRAQIAAELVEARRLARQTDAAEGTPKPQYAPADILVNARF
jgi:hypothetical protein